MPWPGRDCSTHSPGSPEHPPHCYKSFAESDLNQAWKFLWHELSWGFQTTYSYFIARPVLSFKYIHVF